MGPRLISRGNDERRLQDRPLGVGFNGAAAASSGYLAASMGPRLISRGNGTGMTGAMVGYQASMGPRLISRGNWWHLVDVDHLPQSASMGPRLISRGNDLAARERRKAARLQWGRD